MGYKVGQVISKTVAEIFVPKLLEEGPQNPFDAQEAFLEVKKLADEWNAHPDNFGHGKQTQKDFNDQQKKILMKYEQMIEDFANGKIKCFTEEVIEVKKLDIEFICTDQGAHKSIREALDDAMLDQVKCKHVGCRNIL